jgi:prepilin peptidase CpaA
MLAKPESIALIFIVVLAARWDLLYRRIPNWLTLPALVAGLVFHGATGGKAGLMASLGGMMAGLLLFGALYLLGGMGAGDVKLMAACGALLTWPQAAAALLYTALAGGGIALAAIVWHRVRRDLTDAIGPATVRNIKLPYGVAIAIGVIWIIIRGPLS